MAELNIQDLISKATTENETSNEATSLNIDDTNSDTNSDATSIEITETSSTYVEGSAKSGQIK